VLLRPARPEANPTPSAPSPTIANPTPSSASRPAANPTPSAPSLTVANPPSAPSVPPAVDATAPTPDVRSPAPSPAVPPNLAAAVGVRSRPAGAAILVDGVRRAVTPATLALPLPLRLVLVRPGYETKRILVTAPGVIDVQLASRPRARRSRVYGEKLD
jgi:PEGA domain-containing protein